MPLKAIFEKEFGVPVALDNDAPETAYELWFQELRLRRFLGPLAEIEALTRVGRLAWQQSRNGDVAAITERLSTIQTEGNLDPIDPDAERDLDDPPPTPPDLTSPLIPPLAEAYEAVRSYPQAVLMYRYQLAALGTDFDQRQPVLEDIARLHRDWFKFSEAIAVYQGLLAGARSQADLASMIKPTSGRKRSPPKRPCLPPISPNPSLFKNSPPCAFPLLGTMPNSATGNRPANFINRPLPSLGRRNNTPTPARPCKPWRPSTPTTANSMKRSPSIKNNSKPPNTPMINTP